MTDLKQFDLVRFANEQNGGPVHRIVSVMDDGWVEIHDIGGYFPPHLFVVADDVGGMPPTLTRCCSDCRWLHGVNCRRRSPITTGGMMSNVETVWPTVAPDDWCGEFERK